VFTVLVFDSTSAHETLIASVAAVTVVLSVFAHGFTAPPLVAAYSEWWRRAGSGSGAIEESRVHEHARRSLQLPAEVGRRRS
jgi:hypothetical protein